MRPLTTFFTVLLFAVIASAGRGEEAAEIKAASTVQSASPSTPAPAQIPGTTPSSAPKHSWNEGFFDDAVRVTDQVVTATDQARLRHRLTLARGLQLIREGKLAEAMKTLEASVAAWPDSAVALTSLAELCYRDDTPRAQEYLDKTKAIDPDYYRLHFIQALVYQKNGKLDQMLESLDRCLELSPEQTRARQLRAEYLQQRVDSPEYVRKAIEDYLVLQQALPQQSILWNFYIGRCYYNLKEYGKAQKYLEPVMASPLGNQAAYLLGLCKQELGEYAEALEYLDRIKGNPIADENVVRIALMQAESSTGEVRLRYKTRALEELALLFKNPNYRPRPDQLILAGKLAIELGLPNAAVEYLEEYLKKIPKDQDAKNLLLHAHMVFGDPDAVERVRELYNEYLSVEPATATIQVRHAYLHYLVKMKQFDPIEKELEALSQLEGEDASMAIIRAQMAFGKERYGDAVREASQALTLPGSKRDEIEMLIGLAYLKDASFENAERHFGLAIQAASETAKGLRYLEIGNLYLDLKMDRKKLEYWNRALELHPNNQQLRYEIGMSYLRSGSTTEALPYFQRVVQDAPEATLKSQAYTLQAYIALVDGSTAEAEKNFRAAIEAWPSNLPAIRGFGHLMSDSSRYKEARELFEMAVAQEPEDATLYIQLGIVCDKLNDIEGAEKAAEAAAQIAPEYAECYNFLGYMYAERGIKLDKALELIQKAMKLEPDNPNITDSLGWVYYQMGDYKKAVETLEKAASLISEEYKRGSSVIYEHLGDAYSKVGGAVKAREMWKLAAEGDPKSRTASDKLEAASSEVTHTTSEKKQP
ncbi:MAG: hypothetical protein AMXMBFR75_04240 [Candidatus Hinthialibacteria bacterium]